MRIKRVLKLIICLIVSVSIIFQCSFSCFAARTFFELTSGDWIIDSSYMYTGRYPDIPLSIGNFHESVYKHSDFNEQCYVYSNHWDDLNIVTEHDFYFPAYPTDNDILDPFDSYVVFSVNDGYVLYVYDYVHLSLINNYDDEYFSFYNVSSESGLVYMYTLSYPYDSWTYISFWNIHKNQNLSLDSSLQLFYTADYIFDYTDFSSIVINPDNYKLQEKMFTHKFLTPLSISSGVLYVEIPSEEVKKLSKKETAFILDKFGFIVGTPTNFVSLSYNFTVRVNGSFYGSANFVDYLYEGYVTDSYFDVGHCYCAEFSDLVDFSDSDISTLDADVDIILSYTFYTSGYNLIFPGNFKIVDYTEYVDEKQHDDIVNKIDSASSQITSSITSASGQITNSVSSAASQISGSVDAVNSNLEHIISGDIDIEQPDMNTIELDDIVAEQDEIVGDILSSLDDNISDFVPAGYDSYTDYLIDNINSFKSSEYETTFTFIRSTFDSLIANLSILPLLLFSLTFGFGVFALGRRLS